MADANDPDSGEAAAGPKALPHLYGGKKGEIGRVLGSPEEALNVFREFKRILASEETQKEYDTLLDYKDSNVITVMQVGNRIW